VGLRLALGSMLPGCHETKNRLGCLVHVTQRARSWRGGCELRSGSASGQWEFSGPGQGRQAQHPDQTCAALWSPAGKRYDATFLHTPGRLASSAGSCLVWLHGQAQRGELCGNKKPTGVKKDDGEAARGLNDATPSALPASRPPSGSFTPVASQTVTQPLRFIKKLRAPISAVLV
jgi:hypothetical protein